MEEQTKKLDNSLSLIAKTSIFLLFGILISKILTYVYRIIIARYYGPEIYGVFSLSLIILSLAVSISSLGLSEGLLRYIPIYRGKNQYYKIKYLLKFSLFVSLISGLIFSILLFIFAENIATLFNNPDIIIFIKIFSSLIPIYIISNIYLATLKSFEKVISYSLIANVAQNIIKIIALLILVYIGFGAKSIAYSYFLGTLSATILAYYVCKYKITILFESKEIDKDQKKKISNELISYSWPIIFSGIFITLFYWVDSFVIGYYLGTTYVGIYNAAIPLVAFFSLVQELFMQLLFPMINKAYALKDDKLISELTKQISSWIFILDIPLFIILMLFPEQIINIIFGKEYLGAVSVLRILSLGAFISFLIPVLNSLISMVGKSKLLLINLVIASIANFGLNLILVKKYGIDGAAISTTLVTIILCIVLLLETRHYTSLVPLRRKMLKVSLISIIPFSILYLIVTRIEVNLLAFIVLSLFLLLVYSLLIFFTGCLNEHDLRLIRKIAKKTPFASRINIGE